jgi:hypothetical protein
MLRTVSVYKVFPIRLTFQPSHNNNTQYGSTNSIESRINQEPGLEKARFLSFALFKSCIRTRSKMTKPRDLTDRLNSWPQPAQLSVNLYCYTCKRYRGSTPSLECAQARIRNGLCEVCEGSLQIKRQSPSRHEQLIQRRNRHDIPGLERAGLFPLLLGEIEEQIQDVGMARLSISGPGTMEPTPSSEVVMEMKTQPETNNQGMLDVYTISGYPLSSLFDYDSQPRIRPPSPQTPCPVPSQEPALTPAPSQPHAPLASLEPPNATNASASLQGATLSPPTDFVIAEILQTHHVAGQFRNDAVALQIISKPKWQIHICPHCWEPGAENYYSWNGYGRIITTGVFQCETCGSYFVIEVEGPYRVKARAMTEAEIMEIFGRRLPPPHYLFRPPAPAPVVDADTGQSIAIGTEPTDKQARARKWDARVTRYRIAREKEERDTLNRAQISELTDFDDVLSRQKPKRPRESNDHNKRAAKKPTLEQTNSLAPGGPKCN